MQDNKSYIHKCRIINHIWAELGVHSSEQGNELKDYLGADKAISLDKLEQIATVLQKCLKGDVTIGWWTKMKHRIPFTRDDE